MKWREYATEDIITWLLEPTDPSVRFWTLQQLEDRQPTDDDVLHEQVRIMDSHCVRTILGKLHQDGHWGDPNNMYFPGYTASTYNLLLLAELGARLNPDIEKAIEHIFKYQRTSGHFYADLPRTSRARSSPLVDTRPCLDGRVLYYLLHFGYFNDERIKRTIECLVENHSENKGWNCKAYPVNPANVIPTNCFMGGIKNLRGLASIPKYMRSSEVKKIIDQEVDWILENEVFRYLCNTDGTRKEKIGWKRFGFPLFYQTDILEVLDVLTSLEVQDERMNESIQLVISSRGKDGKWILSRSFNGKMICSIETKGAPSKWITLRALKVLKRFLQKDFDSS